ncbi:hypothetical protein GCM10010129_57580 [Streptomyces fumigatiscleroticus]|nr:hypothetical protein GCM10010129_57580 [Streptomyces fumigatiscleroticus]
MTNLVKKLDLGTLMTCCLAVAAAQLRITVPSSINGEITAAFNASGSQVTWVTSAFIVPTAILELNFGVVGDLFRDRHRSTRPDGCPRGSARGPGSACPRLRSRSAGS